LRFKVAKQVDGLTTPGTLIIASPVCGLAMPTKARKSCPTVVAGSLLFLVIDSAFRAQMTGQCKLAIANSASEFHLIDG
jgi:hypothetical protein